jgi:hypothetical protein
MKTALRVLVSIGAAFACIGPVLAGEFTPAANNSAKIWNKYPNAKRRIEWRGTVDRDGFATGRGVALFKTGSDVAVAYLGTMVRGRMEGDAVAIYPLTGMGYVGQIVDWSEHGYGMMRFADGSRYEGQWKAGNREGQGTQWSQKGDVAYQGMFVNDQPASRSPSFERPSFHISTGGLVQTKFRSVKIRWFGGKDGNGLASGFGVAVSNGEHGIAGIYHGLATAGRLDTNVMAIYANYDARMAYVGEISGWNENGYGQMFYPNGTTYIGHWKDEKRHGEGVILSATGQEVERGWFEADKLVQRYARATRVVEPEEDIHRFDELPSSRSSDRLDSEQQAFNNILAIIAGQWLLDAVVDPNNSEEGAFISLVSRHYVRAPKIDGNLKILLPDMPDAGIRWIRNMICSICDGNPSGEDLLRRTIRSETTAFAREIGTTEGEATRLLFFLKDFSNRLETIKKTRRDEE